MGNAMAWAMLVASGLIDVAWAYAAKRSAGFTHIGWSAISLLLLAAFIVLLTRALQVLPLGTAYLVWTGIGAVGTLALGAIMFAEPLGGPRLAFAGIVLLGIAGLKLVD